MRGLEITVRRVFAVLCGIGSILFAGQIAMLVAIDTPAGDPLAGIVCIARWHWLPYFSDFFSGDHRVYCSSLAVTASDNEFRRTSIVRGLIAQL
jgi:hypothetical protein